jgi:hypothetical protein
MRGVGGLLFLACVDDGEGSGMDLADSPWRSPVRVRGKLAKRRCDARPTGSIPLQRPHPAVRCHLSNRALSAMATVQGLQSRCRRAQGKGPAAAGQTGGCHASGTHLLSFEAAVEEQWNMSACWTIFATLLAGCLEHRENSSSAVRNQKEFVTLAG